MKKLIFALLLSLAFSGQAMAQKPWYLEIAIGEADIDAPGREIAQVPTLYLSGGSRCIPISNCYTTSSLAWPDGEGNRAGRISLGRNFGRYFSIDASYLKFREFEAKEDPDGYFMVLSYETRQAVEGFNLSASARYPLMDSLHVFAKAGLYAYKSEKTDIAVPQGALSFRPLTPEGLGLGSVEFYADDERLEITEKERGTTVNVSIGASYAITQSVDLKLEYQHLPDVENTDINLYLLGLAFRF